MFFEEVLPGKTCKLSSGEVLGVPVEDKPLKLLLVVNRNLHYLQVNGVAIVERLPDELKIDY